VSSVLPHKLAEDTSTLDTSTRLRFSVTGNLLLDWAIVAVSLFNTILMLWLGLTVWLNAAQRTIGVWVTSLSLFIGGAFFVSHSAIVGQGLGLTPGMDVWWQAGLWAVMVLPFAWYSVTLWHTGLWNERPSRMQRRHRVLFSVTALMLLAMAGLLITANPLPSFSRVLQLSLAPTPSLIGWPVLVIAYPAYSLVCLMLALDALLRPGAPANVAGEAARARARPWLVGATALLLAVSLLVAGVMALLVRSLIAQRVELFNSNLLLGLGLVDLVTEAFVAGVVVLVGQAIVTYEVFTGQTLPRQSLQRYWRRAVLLAAGYGLGVGWALSEHLQPVYAVLLTAVMMTAFYALLSWRANTERERTMRQLRPFVASERRYETLLTTEADPPDALALFRTLCRDVLGARQAHLLALGPFAPLVGPALAYPPDAPAPRFDLSVLGVEAASPQTMCVPLDPAHFEGLHWAVPLWSQRGLIGVLLLGDKATGGLYLHEEVEIARASGERLVDAQASAEMTRRLLALQRQRLAESQVVDRRVRREIHDDILPRLHAALLELSANGGHSEGLQTLANVHRQLADLLRAMPNTTAPQLSNLGLFGALKHIVEVELPGSFDHVIWAVSPAAKTEAARLPAFAAETVYYAAREAIRNAARYGRGGTATRALTLRVAADAERGLQLIIEDNGVGLGAPSSEGDGTRQGLALHSTLMAVIGGTLAVSSQPDAHTRITLSVPLVAAVPASPTR
jgi:signal transduction histidine kinase